MGETYKFASMTTLLLSISASYAIICGPNHPPCPDGYYCKTCKKSAKGRCVQSPQETHYADCRDVLNAGFTTSGVYTVTTWSTNTQIDVYCDMETDGGGLTVFQRRVDGSLDFSKNWVEYENGFGDANFEHWLGLRYIKEMADRGATRLRLHVTDVNDATVYRQFENFFLSPGLYNLNIGTASGDPLSNSFQHLFYHNGRPFTTSDSDNDLRGGENCATISGGGGWWFNNCYKVYLNGVYATPGTFAAANGWIHGILHSGFTSWIPYKSSSMMLRLI